MTDYDLKEMYDFNADDLSDEDNAKEFIIEELRTVLYTYEVQAKDEDEAMELYFAGKLEHKTEKQIDKEIEIKEE